MPSPITQLLAPQGPVVSAVRTRFPNAMAIYAFGSQLQGTVGPQSDLDLAVLVAGYADPLVLWDLAGHLADVVGCPVDMLDLRAASTVSCNTRSSPPASACGPWALLPAYVKPLY